ncbi:MAG: molybdenum cofactor biosynthesis protein B [Rhodothermales bacterium]
MSHKAHRTSAEQYAKIRCAVITISDTRTEETDRSGGLTQVRLEKAGHTTVLYRIVPDEPAIIRQVLQKLAGKVEVVLFNGGTGISKRDQTYEAISSMLEKKLPGFGELFRMLSYEEIGPAAMLSRATAGVYQNTLVFSMPGSLNAVKLALDKLILPDLKHFVWEIVRQQEA